MIEPLTVKTPTENFDVVHNQVQAAEPKGSKLTIFSTQESILNHDLRYVAARCAGVMTLRIGQGAK